MRTDASTTRTAGLSATTLVALMAMATATTCSAMAVPKVAHAPAESRALLIEGQSVRHVAAAMAAIARDLFGSDHVEHAFAEPAWTEQYLPIVKPRLTMLATDRGKLAPPLIEQLLDLPPPAC